MRILVPIKRVGVLDPDFELEDGTTLDPDYLTWATNEWDVSALVAALRLRDTVGGEVCVVTVGDDAADEVLVESLARGADRALAVRDEVGDIAGPLEVARVLAAVVAREKPDLVLCGAQSADLGHAATGIAAAGFAGLAHVAAATSIAVDDAGSSLIVGRGLEGGIVERLRIALPALLTVQMSDEKPGLVTLRGLEDARRQPVEALSPADLGLSGTAQLPGRQTLRAAPPRGRAEMLEGDPAEAAQRILGLLRERTTGPEARA